MTGAYERGATLYLTSQSHHGTWNYEGGPFPKSSPGMEMFLVDPFSNLYVVTMQLSNLAVLI